MQLIFTAWEKSSLNGQISDSFRARCLVTSSQQQSQEQLLGVFWLQHTFSWTSVTLHLNWLRTELLPVPALWDKFPMSMQQMKCMICFSPCCEPRELRLGHLIIQTNASGAFNVLLCVNHISNNVMHLQWPGLLSKALLFTFKENKGTDT